MHPPHIASEKSTLAHLYPIASRAAQSPKEARFLRILPKSMTMRHHHMGPSPFDSSYTISSVFRFSCACRHVSLCTLPVVFHHRSNSLRHRRVAPSPLRKRRLPPPDHGADRPTLLSHRHSQWQRAVRSSRSLRAHRPSTPPLYHYCPPLPHCRALPRRYCSNPLSEGPQLLWIARYSICKNSARTAAPGAPPFPPALRAVTTNVLEK